MKSTFSITCGDENENQLRDGTLYGQTLLVTKRWPQHRIGIRGWDWQKQTSPRGRGQNNANCWSVDVVETSAKWMRGRHEEVDDEGLEIATQLALEFRHNSCSPSKGQTQNKTTFGLQNMHWKLNTKTHLISYTFKNQNSQ